MEVAELETIELTSEELQVLECFGETTCSCSSGCIS